MPATSLQQFREILRQVGREYQIQCSDGDLDQIVSFIDVVCNHQLSGSRARDLISILVDNAEHEGRSPTLTVAAVDMAYQQFTGLASRSPLRSTPGIVEDEGLEDFPIS